MKKKTLLALIAVATLSLAACGKTEETSGSNVNEPVVESTVESQVAESTTQEVVESTEASSEAPASEEAPAVAEEKPYEMSELIYPEGMTSDPINYDEFYNNGMYTMITLQPYYTVTNTSDEAYNIYIDPNQGNGFSDRYFEPGETMTLPAFVYHGDANLYGEENLGYWMNVDESSELLQYGKVTISEADPSHDTVHGMTSITIDSSKFLAVEDIPSAFYNEYMKEMSVDLGLPLTKDNLNSFRNMYTTCRDTAGSTVFSNTNTFIHFYDENGNNNYESGVINTSITCHETWATLDVYYSYEAAQ